MPVRFWLRSRMMAAVTDKDSGTTERLDDVGGGIGRQQAVDSLHVRVTPALAAAGGEFQVEVHVNGVEMTAAGAGLGMDPYDVLVPVNRLVAVSQPHTMPIARCECGVYGCGATDVTITRDGDVVRWDWSIEAPMNRSVSFAADEYDCEIARVAADHSWETPVRTAGRLVLTDMDRERLLAHGLRPTWVADDHRDSAMFWVTLNNEDNYQVYVKTPWHDRGPEDLAHEVCATLALPPSEWHASWHPINPRLTEPPRIAGPSWQRQQF
jgi:hypothetical protein